MSEENVEIVRAAWTFTIRDGALRRAYMYQERDEALNAVGLQE